MVKLKPGYVICEPCDGDGVGKQGWCTLCDGDGQVPAPAPEEPAPLTASEEGNGDASPLPCDRLQEESAPQDADVRPSLEPGSEAPAESSLGDLPGGAGDPEGPDAGVPGSSDAGDPSGGASGGEDAAPIEPAAEDPPRGLAYCPRCTQVAAPGGKHCAQCRSAAKKAVRVCEVRTCQRTRARSFLCAGHARAFGSSPLTLPEWLALTSLPTRQAEPGAEPEGAEAPRPVGAEPKTTQEPSTELEACCEAPRCYADPKPGERYCAKHLEWHVYESSPPPVTPEDFGGEDAPPAPAVEVPRARAAPAPRPLEADIAVLKECLRATSAALDVIRRNETPEGRRRFHVVRGGLIALTHRLRPAEAALAAAVTEIEGENVHQEEKEAHGN